MIDLFGYKENKKWFKESKYTNPQYFANTCKSINYKKGRGMYTVEE